MRFDVEVVLDWQQRGMTARVLGLPLSDNPLLISAPANRPQPDDEWYQKADAWSFGWAIEDSVRG
ncbi:MAG: CrpP-related protein [Tsuneonella sp.]